MIELPEALARAEEMKHSLTGKTVERVLPPSSPHKFCWFNGDAAEYDGLLTGRTVLSAEGFGIFVELSFDQNMRLCVNDGVNVRFLPEGSRPPEKYQLRLDFTDGATLAMSVAMYGAIICHDGNWDNEYYQKSRDGLSPLSDEFNAEYFDTLLDSVKPSLSAKAFLATEQRIPGIGNGVLQDILYEAGVHPKRQIGSLNQQERTAVFTAVRAVLGKMTAEGGRDTERDLFGRPGRYRTRMSRHTLGTACTRCGGSVTKMTYLGGAVYFCQGCQIV